MKFRSILKFVLPVLLIAVIAQQSTAQLANGKSKFLGNITGSSVQSNWSTYWNQVTSENGCKWGTVQGGGQTSWNWSQADVAYNYAQSHGYKFKYHNFVWGAQQPSWVNSSNVKSALQTYMNNVKGRYSNIWAIDVVNEPIKTACSYASGLGGSGSTGWDWVITAFQMARNTFGSGVKLLINEYGTEPDANARNTYKTIINLLKSRGLIDGIGIQCHAFNLDGMSASQMQTCLDDLATTGVDIYVSELDIRGQGSTINETAQKNKYAELFPVMWNHASVKGITLWGYIEGQTWLANTGILNSNGTERQAMTWLKSFMAGTGGNTLSVSTTSLSVGAAANSTGTFNITSNVNWTVSSNQTWLAVSPTSGSNNSTVTVTAQQNTGTSSRSATVTVTATGVSQATVTVTQAGTGGGSTSIWLEAECASVGSLWNKPTDANASNTHYVTIQSGNNSTSSAPTNTAGYINFSFSVSQSGTYYMFARVKCPTANDDSYWVRMDGGSWVMWNNLTTTSWAWMKFPNTFSLSTGSHTLTFVYREDGAELDKIDLSTSSTAPSGTGSAASNLCTPKIREDEELNHAYKPEGFELAQNYPNPFNPTTYISFGLPENSFVSLRIYNSLGEEIAELGGREFSAGWNIVRFDATNLASGVYFYTIRAGQYTSTQKMIFQK